MHRSSPAESRARVDVSAAHAALDRLVDLVRGRGTPFSPETRVARSVDEVVVVVQAALHLLNELSRDAGVSASSEGARLDASRQAIAAALRDAEHDATREKAR